MDAVTFERLFRDQITCAVNWRALRRADITSYQRLITERRALGDLFTPWYDGGDKWSDDKRRRITVRQAAKLGRKDHRARLLELAAAFADEQPGAMLMPALSVHRGLLLLDGTHRCVALHIARAKPRVALAVLSLRASDRAAFFDA